MKIGVYCRVSGLSQRETLHQKIKKVQVLDFVNLVGYEYEVYTDVARGGKLDRKVFSKVIEECKSGKIDGIWVYTMTD